MCWSRKGVPGSKRSGGAGTPFLDASCRAKLRERAGSRVLAGVPRRESGGQWSTRERHRRPTWANRLSRRRSGGERVVGRLLRQGDEVELVLDCEEGRTSIDHSAFSDFQGVRRRPQHAEVAGEDALARREEDALTPHVHLPPAFGLWPGAGGIEGRVSGLDER